jgi:hypothetical protein
VTKLTQLTADSELFQLQHSFTGHLRNPDLVPVPEGLDPRRMEIYSNLIFHNIASLISEFFPVIYSMSSKEEWENLIREFFISYRAETPYFPKLAEEFLQFLLGREGANETPDYFISLAHYEWIELGLFISESELPESLLDDASLRSQTLHLSDLAIPIAYQYPVHQIQDGWEEHKQVTYLLVFRDQEDDVRFFELQPLAYELLSAMQNAEDAGLNVEEWLKNKAIEFKQSDIEVFVNAGLNLVHQFNQERLFYIKDH